MAKKSCLWNIGWDILLEPEIKNILIVGCGGGFDFVHSLLFYHDLQELNKKIIIGSYSFGNPLDYKSPSINSTTTSLTNDFQQNIVFKASSTNLDNQNNNENSIEPVVVQVTSNSIGSPYYCPELGYCQYLDHLYPQHSPHSIYAYYARAFTIQTLTEFYSKLISDHKIDVIIAVDGGTDSLMKGNEYGLGDPIEDAITVGVLSNLCSCYSSFSNSLSNLNSNSNLSKPNKPLGLLYSIGFGCDRFNYVSDASSLRAVAEITQLGGYLGILSILPNSHHIQMYQEGLKFIYNHQEMRSILSGSILASSLGFYGSEDISSIESSQVDFGKRIISDSNDLYLWPLMSMIWMFDITVVGERSLIVKWIQIANTPKEAEQLMNKERKKLFQEDKLLQIENLPLAKDDKFFTMNNNRRKQNEDKEEINENNEQNNNQNNTKKTCCLS